MTERGEEEDPHTHNPDFENGQWIGGEYFYSRKKQKRMQVGFFIAV